ncbi:MAG TPA: Trm112 family protein [Pyrinomonadaceae bacterium]|nr:Trm112 family protein [Pyrinomonadaceae bacterium]
MAITAEFIETFRVVCPACRGRVELKRDGSGIKCLECRRVYPIRNDIPALVVDEATIEEDDEPRNAG